MISQWIGRVDNRYFLSSRMRVTTWTVAKPQDFKSDVGAKFEVGQDQSVFVSGTNGHDTYRFNIVTDIKNVTGIKLEAMNDGRLPAGGPGRAQNGNFVLNEFKLFAAPKNDPAKRVEIKLTKPEAPFVANLAMDFASIVSKEYHDAMAAAGTIQRNR